MGYQIQYHFSGKARRISAKNRRLQISLLILCVCVSLSILLWAGKKELTTSIAALELMAMKLGQGSSMKEAFTAFCLQVLQGA